MAEHDSANPLHDVEAALTAAQNERTAVWNTLKEAWRARELKAVLKACGNLALKECVVAKKAALLNLKAISIVLKTVKDVVIEACKNSPTFTAGAGYSSFAVGGNGYQATFSLSNCINSRSIQATVSETDAEEGGARMHYRSLGRTGIPVSTVAMGTWQSFDVRDDRAVQHVRQLVTEALRCGVNLFDTAPMYGQAEEVLGAVLRGAPSSVLNHKSRDMEQKPPSGSVRSGMNINARSERPMQARTCSLILVCALLTGTAEAKRPRAFRERRNVYA